MIIFFCAKKILFFPYRVERLLKFLSRQFYLWLTSASQLILISTCVLSKTAILFLLKFTIQGNTFFFSLFRQPNPQKVFFFYTKNIPCIIKIYSLLKRKSRWKFYVWKGKKMFIMIFKRIIWRRFLSYIVFLQVIFRQQALKWFT